ncbi:MAG: hypothetical protein LKF81_10860 [Prevotella sp.]|nr:hypothetical protein [Prevotella sp.]
MNNLKEAMKDDAPGHLYPFFWQKGAKPEVLKKYICVMQEQGIKNFCIESRPHPEFLEDGWWKTMDLILSEAKARNMHVWILDDDRFPTGHAAGKVPVGLKRHYLAEHCYDYISTGSEAEFDLSAPCGAKELMMNRKHSQDRVIACIAVSRDVTKNKGIVTGTEIDVTEHYHNKLLRLRLNPGTWCIQVIYDTVCSQGRGVEDYLDPMRPEATDVLIDQIYEKHYSHYSQYFGNTIEGFFSDEPSFGNATGRHEIIGRSDMPLPWNEEVQKQLKIRGIDNKEMGFLFLGEGDRPAACRWIYMDVITELYKKNFTERIGTWCKKHSVIYVGHVIEDDNAHARLGAGPGHYFRSIAGQDMAGIDIIGGQLVPGMNYQHDAFSTGGSDGEFYQYALCRLGASAAKLDPKKNGRLMCEAFGAYGWIEGLKMMKWITDHMLSHGVNNIVPHAFDPAEFPDSDCPPHFYAHGMNPQYPYFHVWANYADRLCRLFSGGVKEARVGILYHAFAEWSGDTMMIQKPCRVLQQAQIDSDIIDEDYLKEAKLENHRIVINQCSYDVLLVPGCKKLPEQLIERLNKISESVRIYAIGEAPAGLKIETIELDEIPDSLKNLTSVHTNKKVPYMASYHYLVSDGSAWMFTNEDLIESVDTDVTLDSREKLVVYDAMKNQTYQLNADYNSNSVRFHLHLNPYESLVLAEGQTSHIRDEKAEEVITIGDGFTIKMKRYNEDEFHVIPETKVCDLSTEYESFSGTIKYSFHLSLNNIRVMLQLPEVYEIAEVEVNTKSCGVRIAPGYLYDIEAAAVIGDNTVVITVVNNLARALRDPFSAYIPMEPLGIVRPIQIFKKANLSH